MLSSILLLDQHLLTLAGRLGDVGWCRGWWAALSHSADLGLVWLVIAAIMALAGRSDEKRMLLSLVAALIVSELVSDVLKFVVARPRPHAYMSYSRLTPWGVFSFPSTHAARSFAAATVLSRRSSPWWAASLFLLATLIGLSRVVLGLHWPSDILGGMVVGLAAGALVILCAEGFSKEPKGAGESAHGR